MIAKIETYVWLDEDNSEEKDAEDVTRLTIAFGDALFDQGYDNVAEKDPSETKLTAVIVISDAKDDDWKKSIKKKSTRGIDFPTGDEKFAKQMDAGLIEGLVL